MTTALATDANRRVLRLALLEVAARRLHAARGGHRQRYLTVDVDSLPIEVHGHQPGSAHNGHYHARIFHPLVASLADGGDLLDVQLRAGNAHTAAGALEFVLPLIEQLEKRLCQVAALRIDAGFPEENFLAALEDRRTPYVARVRNNKVLDAMAQPHLRRPVGRPPREPRAAGLMTSSDVAKALGVGVTTVRRLERAVRVRAPRVGRLRLRAFSTEDLEQLRAGLRR